ncbi:hypothetical protein FA95DRAFT_1611293 [Auriscalpium vulgare]|uniref:Uncharacterized protein n=1 Tax=Auriscalpium vulgare TaxID=40419 RepID=A0ACB8RBT0_9AGAM|nr:hypothetical protein FA95DRAFT_1611293 [Auriscalpium vulgare]
MDEINNVILQIRESLKYVCFLAHGVMVTSDKPKTFFLEEDCIQEVIEQMNMPLEALSIIKVAKGATWDEKLARAIAVQTKQLRTLILQLPTDTTIRLPLHMFTYLQHLELMDGLNWNALDLLDVLHELQQLESLSLSNIADPYSVGKAAKRLQVPLHSLVKLKIHESIPMTHILLQKLDTPALTSRTITLKVLPDSTDSITGVDNRLGVGTPLVAYINTHLCVDSETSRSHAWMLVYFLRRTLPWRKLKVTMSATWDLIDRDAKLQHAATLAQNLPPECSRMWD